MHLLSSRAGVSPPSNEGALTITPELGSAAQQACGQNALEILRLLLFVLPQTTTTTTDHHELTLRPLLCGCGTMELVIFFRTQSFVKTVIYQCLEDPKVVLQMSWRYNLACCSLLFVLKCLKYIFQLEVLKLKRRKQFPQWNLILCLASHTMQACSVYFAHQT